jgi:hypothetical protein
VSGELKTLARIPGTGYPLSRADTAVLACSDTSGGLLAGRWNAIALTGGDLSRVRYLGCPDAPLGPVRGHALVVRVPGLDAGEEDGFRRAMGGLGTLGRNLLQSGELRRGEPILFCLTGGYKATMPYLIGLAEGLRAAIRCSTRAPRSPSQIDLLAGSSCFRLGAADERGIRTLSPGENPGRTARPDAARVADSPSAGHVARRPRPSRLLSRRHRPAPPR